jgi:hypothetical protein
MAHPGLIAVAALVAVPLALLPILACADDQIDRGTQQLRQSRMQYEQQEMKQRLEELENQSRERESLESLRSPPVVTGPLPVSPDHPIKGSEAYRSPLLRSPEEQRARDAELQRVIAELREVTEQRHKLASALPTFPKNSLYGDARTALIALGYQPVKLPDADKCDVASDYARCFPERQSCAGTGLAQCNFVWRRTERVIIVGTIGEDPKVASVRCLSGC